MGNQLGNLNCCTPCSLSEQRASPTPGPANHVEPREDPAGLFRSLDATAEEEQKQPRGLDGEAREAVRLGGVHTSPRRAWNSHLSRQAADDLADVFPQARARAARRHLSGAASKSSSDLSMQIALKVWTFAAG